MGLLVRRELVPLFLGPSLSASYVASPTERTMRVLSPDGQPLGYVNSQTIPETEQGLPGTRISLQAALRMQFMGDPIRLHMIGTAWMARTGRTGTFDFTVRSEEHSARFEGKLDGGMLDARVHTAGYVYPVAFPLDREIVIGGVAGTSTLQLAALKPGDEAIIETFDPMTLTMGTARIKCIGVEPYGEGGDAQEARVVTVTVHDTVTKAWIDEHGETLRAETQFGLVLERSEPHEAYAAYAREVPADLIDAVAIRPSGKRPMRDATRMVIAVSGIGEDRTLPEDDAQQALDDGRLVIAPQPPGGAAADPGSEELAEHLAPHPFIQSDHPDIMRTAAEITAGAEDPWEKAQRIHDWVFENIDKKGVASIPSALEVLNMRTGDCNEHAVLFAALARAEGIPTRIVLGVVWSEELQGFYYHAWPEVFVGQWVWMDPTFGQRVADATHVKLVVGDIERWPRLMAFLGRLHIEVLEVE